MTRTMNFGHRLSGFLYESVSECNIYGIFGQVCCSLRMCKSMCHERVYYTDDATAIQTAVSAVDQLKDCISNDLTVATTEG